MAIDTLVTPSFYRRVTAWFVDCFLVWGLIELLCRVIFGFWLFGRVPPFFVQSLVAHKGAGVLALYWIQISYYGLFHGLAGCTPGKAIMSLRVVDADGNAAAQWQIMLRSLLYPGLWFIPLIIEIYGVPYFGHYLFTLTSEWFLLRWLLGIIVIIFCLFPPLDYIMTPFDFNGQRSLHDLFSHTRVVVE